MIETLYVKVFRYNGTMDSSDDKLSEFSMSHPTTHPIVRSDYLKHAYEI